MAVAIQLAYLVFTGNDIIYAEFLIIKSLQKVLKVCDSGARGANLKCAQHQMDNGDCAGPVQDGPN
eukprot:COSAG02_NODE_54132_length_297_cov_27.919192_1_plen_65_part_10